MRYQIFDLRLEPDGKSDVRVHAEAHAGEASTTAGRDLVSLSSQSPASFLRDDSLKSRSAQIELGEKLFRGVLRGSIRDLFERSLEALSDENDGLVIQFRFDATESRIAPLLNLPWELLYYPPQKQFLSLDRRTPVVRCLGILRRKKPLFDGPPLRVLLVTAQIRGAPKLRTDEAVERIRTAASARQDIQIHTVKRATRQRLREELLATKPHVLHIMTHGAYRKLQGQPMGHILLEDDRERPVPLSPSDLAHDLHGVSDLGCVLLDACETAQSSLVDPLTSVASHLALKGLPAVIAMSAQVSDQAATLFSEVLYQRMAALDPLEAAVTEARLAVSRRANSVQWAVPSLLLRTNQTHSSSEQPRSQQTIGEPLADSAQQTEQIMQFNGPVEGSVIARDIHSSFAVGPSTEKNSKNDQ